MKVLLLASVLLSTNTVANDDVLDKLKFTIGAGHKIEETDMVDPLGAPLRQAVSARFDFFYEYSTRLKFGISHHSQWAEGYPFNDREEYRKTELFIDVTFSVGDIKSLF